MSSDTEAGRPVGNLHLDIVIVDGKCRLTGPVHNPSLCLRIIAAAVDALARVIAKDKTQETKPILFMADGTPVHTED